MRIARGGRVGAAAKADQRNQHQDQDQRADRAAQRQQPVIVKLGGLAADRRDLLLNALPAVGLADAGGRQHVPDASGNDGRRLGRIGLAGILRGAGGRRRSGGGRRILGGRTRLGLSGCRCEPGRGQGNRPSNQSHLNP